MIVPVYIFYIADFSEANDWSGRTKSGEVEG